MQLKVLQRFAKAVTLPVLLVQILPQIVLLAVEACIFREQVVYRPAMLAFMNLVTKIFVWNVIQIAQPVVQIAATACLAKAVNISM